MENFNFKKAKQHLLSEVKVNKPAIGQIRSKDLFIQKNGGNLKAFKFNSVDDVDNELQRIYDDYGYDSKPFSLYGGPGEEFEDIYGINPSLLKDFFKYNSKFIDEIKVNKPGGSRVYVSRINKDIFKIKNFPALSESDKRNIQSKTYRIPFDLRKKENSKFWIIIDKIRDYLQEDIEKFPSITFFGEFLSSDNPYIIKEDPNVFIILQDLEYLGKDEDWDLNQDWKEI